MRWLVFNLVLYAATRCLAQPPPNDDFTNRIALAGPVAIFGGDTTEATRQEDDNEPCGYDYDCGNSIWWSWTAQDFTPVIIERLGKYSVENAGMTVYTGNSFSEMRSSRVGEISLPKRGQFLAFQPQPGTEYQIQVAGHPSKLITYQLTVTNSPVFRLQPQTQTVSSNASVLFSALAVGIKPLHYQWMRDGLEIPGATNLMLSLNGVTWNEAGDYCVVVTNATGVSTSQIAKLLVSANDPAPLLVAGVVDANRFQFSVIGERGRRYRSECSSNLLSWDGGIIFNTNETTSFSVTNDMPAKFLRLSVYRPESEICVNNLRQVRSALLLCAEDNHLSDSNDMAPGRHGLDSYFINGAWPRCPSPIYQVDWYNYLVIDVITTPTCWVGPPTHMLEER